MRSADPGMRFMYLVRCAWVSIDKRKSLENGLLESLLIELFLWFNFYASIINRLNFMLVQFEDNYRKN